MKFTKVLFGHVVTVKRALPRYTVVLETIGYTEVADYRSLIGAFLAARSLAKSRRNGWAERAVTYVFDKYTGKQVFGFKSSVKHKSVTRFVKF